MPFVTIGRALGLPSDQAFALGFLIHVSILILTSVGGAIAVLRLGWNRSAGEVAEVARGLVEPEVPAEVGVAPPARPAPGPPR